MTSNPREWRYANSLFEAGYSMLDLIAGLCILSSLFCMSYSTLPSKGSKSARQFSEQIVALLDQTSLLAQWSGIAREVQQEEGNLRIVSLENGVHKKVEQLSLPSNLHLEMRFGTIKNTPNVLVLWANGQATPGTIRVVSERANSCFIHQALRGARRIECTK